MQNAGYSLSIATLSYVKLVKSGVLLLSKVNLFGYCTRAIE